MKFLIEAEIKIHNENKLLLFISLVKLVNVSIFLVI